MKKTQKGGNDRIYEYLYRKLTPSKKTLKKIKKKATAENGKKVGAGIKYAASRRRVYRDTKKILRKKTRRRGKPWFDFVDNNPEAAQILGAILSTAKGSVENKKSW